jgi:hypothetical protein
VSHEYGDSLAVLAYHRRVAGDTISPEYISIREDLYGITSSPSTVFDGTSGIVQTEDTSQNYSTFKGWIISERNVPPLLRFHLETNVVSSQVTASLHIITIDSIETSEYRLFFVLYEDDVYFKQVGAPDSIFNFVVRKMVPDEQGMLLDLSYPDSLVKEVNFNVLSNWDIDKLGIVAFVQDIEALQVLQAIVDKRINSN